MNKIRRAIWCVVLFLPLICLSGEIQEHLKLILSMKNLSVTNTDELTPPWIEGDQSSLLAENETNEEIEGIVSPKSAMLQQDHSDNSVQKKATKYSTTYETRFVSVIVLDGYKIHVADYYDGTRVVSFLDGDMKGYQAGSVNGVFTGDSRNVEWHKNYFVHRYPRCKITSYPNKQIFEIK